MSRPKKERMVREIPQAFMFSPGSGLAKGEVTLTLDEWEALRLADELGLSQEKGASNMGVSRQTFGRLLYQARGKVAKAVVHGLMIRIAPEIYPDGTLFSCEKCGYTWPLSFPISFPIHCPHCNGRGIFSRQGGRRWRGGRGNIR